MFQPHPLPGLASSIALPVREWRWAAFGIGIGAILLAIGLLAIGIFLFRKRSSDHTLLFFGVFVVIYAVRMFMRESVLLSSFNIPRSLASHIERTITFTIALPALFVFLEIVPARWRRIIWWTLAVQLAFAAVAVPLDFLGIALRPADITNSALVLTSWVLLIIFLFFLRPPGRLPGELRVVAVGFAVFSLFVLHDNLLGLRLIRGREIEPLGFLFFICTLGYFVAHNIFAKEESFISIQKELQIAEQIQSSILPREIPRLPGLEIAARYLPMSAVAGDFYDFLEPEKNQLGILIADVTGHGVPAALIASMLKVAFAGQSHHAHDPVRVLSGLNKALCGKFEDHFVTAAYVFLDLNNRVLRYAGAGHPPLLFTGRSDGEPRSIEQNGMFLGMFPEASYSSMEVPLNPGDRYLLYTDGLPESRNQSGEEFGLARCKQLLQAHSGMPAEAIADTLLAEIASWEGRSLGHSQQDDFTLLVVDYLADS